MTPFLTTMFLVGSAVILAGGFYFARDIASDGGQQAPKIGMWSDDGNDRLLVILGDPDADWQDIEVQTDVPAEIRFDGGADTTPPANSTGSGFVPLAGAPRQVVGGDALSLCRLDRAGPVEVTLRDRPSNTVVFQQTMSLQAC